MYINVLPLKVVMLFFVRELTRNLQIISSVRKILFIGKQHKYLLAYNSKYKIFQVFLLSEAIKKL